MKTLGVWLFAISFFVSLFIPARAAQPESSAQSNEDSASANTFLLSVVFKNVDFIYTGDVAHYTASNQNIRFVVFPTSLVNEDTNQSLLNGPDAFFAISDNAFRVQAISQPFQYCLDMLRELLISPNPNLEMFMFLRVRNVTGVNFVVREFHSCGVQSPP